MKPLQRAYVPSAELFETIKEFSRKWEAGDPEIRKAIPAANLAEAQKEITEHIIRLRNEAYFLNDQYQVAVREIESELGPMVHLSIRRLDREPVRDWRDMQAIKNQLVGPECEGVELYPAESRKVDAANQYHMWVVKDPQVRFPFGFVERLVTETLFHKSKQRPL